MQKIYLYRREEEVKTKKKNWAIIYTFAPIAKSNWLRAKINVEATYFISVAVNTNNEKYVIRNIGRFLYSR